MGNELARFLVSLMMSCRCLLVPCVLLCPASSWFWALPSTRNALKIENVGTSVFDNAWFGDSRRRRTRAMWVHMNLGDLGACRAPAHIALGRLGDWTIQQRPCRWPASLCDEIVVAQCDALRVRRARAWSNFFLGPV